MTTVSRARLAEIWKLAPSAIDKLYTRQLCVKVGVDKYDLEASDALYVPHLRKMAAGRPEKSAAREKLLQAQTKLVDIKREQAEGGLVSLHRTVLPLLQKIFSAHQEAFFAVPDTIWREFKFDTPTMTVIEHIIDAARTLAADAIKETPVEFTIHGKKVIAPAAPRDLSDVEQSATEAHPL
jgi:phage terminase Nu1 subunit (DNA packaging protein)